MSDGGEGFLAAMPGSVREVEVTGPLGDPVLAPWKRDVATGYVEVALASGLELVGGPEGNDSLGATTTGTGELIAAAFEAGCREVVVGLGGSASTDGGLGAVRVLENVRRRGTRLVAACDVDVAFLDAARSFGPQKGASPRAVELLTRRLVRVSQLYAQEFGVVVTDLPRAGSAGGLAGGLAALGAELLGGAEFVAERVGVADLLERAEGVITGEGHLDEHSFQGKCVGTLLDLANANGLPVLIVVGSAEQDALERAQELGATVIDLASTWGEESAWRRTVEVAVASTVHFVASFT